MWQTPERKAVLSCSHTCSWKSTHTRALLTFPATLPAAGPKSADILPPTHDHCFLLLLLWRHRSELRSDRELSEGRGCAVIPLDAGKWALRHQGLFSLVIPQVLSRAYSMHTFLLTLALVQRPPSVDACMSLLLWSPFFIPFLRSRPFPSPVYNIPCIHSRGHLTSFPCGKINFRLHKGKGHSELPYSWEWSLLDKKNLPLAPIFHIIW